MKYLIELDQDAFAAASQRLGTSTVTDTVNAALRLATGHAGGDEVEAALVTWAAMDLPGRANLWR